METVAEFAASGGPVLGICNGFQVLCEAGLLPGALLPNEGLRFLCRQVDVEVADADSAWTRRLRARRRLSIPVKHTTGRCFAPPSCSSGSRRTGRSSSATRAARTRTARSTTSPGSATSAATSSG